MSKVIAEYDARLVVLKQREDTEVFNGQLALCKDGKVLGFVKRDRGQDEQMVILGMHYKIEDKGTLSLARLYPSNCFEDYVRSELSIMHGEYLPETEGSVEFGGLHFRELRQTPSLLNLVHNSEFAKGSIERLRNIPVAELERMLKNKKRIYDGAGNNNLEVVAIGNGQTTKLVLYPKA